MSDRLDRIVTRTGDDGSTGLADGRRVPKHDPRIEALGAVDELNSFVGLLAAEALDDDLAALLAAIQNDLFDLGGELALPERPQVGDGHLGRIEAAVATFNAELPPLAEFVLPGGGRPAALAHVCRSVCRRAERRLTALAAVELLATGPGKYLNRLSDLFFVLARTLNRRAGRAEPTWRGPAR
ncbi:cob(I)yrinic acid a,c-diamide adenosyltransferase [Parasulfuritortus cantonensis]|uniref:Cobalamin adenosyltransferase n=1 Tax=Parasulfuritortus cantonensis TaxID=2528202 RepID=A0A4R1BKU6_9PROT|nr:cob(I)yrinic acid a,c-diamide adenosyltransferase [Parasulfuritortus cantonensis]TCJ18020.1 cob(I)yrinic acid a,c-diamide adenosyltransferase [Parasulfuritortus cantonensis]